MLSWLFLEEMAGHFCLTEINTDGLRQLEQSRTPAFMGFGAEAEDGRIWGGVPLMTGRAARLGRCAVFEVEAAKI